LLLYPTNADQHPPGKIPLKTPSDSPVVVCIVGPHSGGEAAAGVPELPVADAVDFAELAAALFGASPGNCWAVSGLADEDAATFGALVTVPAAAPVDADTDPACALPAAEVGTLRGSQPETVEQTDCEEPAMPDEPVSGESNAAGGDAGPAWAFAWPLVCARAIPVTANQRTIARIGIRTIARSCSFKRERVALAKPTRRQRGGSAWKICFWPGFGYPGNLK